MDEFYLHFIWQYQLFDKSLLKTTDGEKITIIKPGFPHQDSGPDFLECKIKVGQITWHGKIEIHVKASDWLLHRHNEDAAYDDVILHVVWHHDHEVKRRDGSIIPALELKSRLDQYSYQNYRNLVGGLDEIPCTPFLDKIPAVILHQMMDRALVQRMESKTDRVFEILKQTKGDWNETAYRLLARNFGFKINEQPFEMLSRFVPYRIIRKHYLQPHQVEALLFGMGGFLEESFRDPYGVMIRQEFHYLMRKYLLPSRSMIRAQWKFLRLRPANFPTIRISQFANLLAFRQNFFTIFKDEEDLPAIIQLFRVRQTQYWTTHYLFDKKSSGKVSAMGKTAAETIVLNTVVPLLMAYAKYSDQQIYFDKAMSLLEKMSSEKNKIINLWAKRNIQSKNAFESQGLMGLFYQYCNPKRCLACGVGLSIVNNSQ